MADVASAFNLMNKLRHQDDLLLIIVDIIYYSCTPSDLASSAVLYVVLTLYHKNHCNNISVVITIHTLTANKQGLTK